MDRQYLAQLQAQAKPALPPGEDSPLQRGYPCLVDVWDGENMLEGEPAQFLGTTDTHGLSVVRYEGFVINALGARPCGKS